MPLTDKIILITGGTGSFGKKCTKVILEKYKPKRLIIFSRDELKQFEMSQVYRDSKYDCIRYFIGDVRDKDRLHRAMNEVDIVVPIAGPSQVRFENGVRRAVKWYEENREWATEVRMD